MSKTTAVTEGKGLITKPEFIRRCCANCELQVTKTQMSALYDTFCSELRKLITEEQSHTLKGIGTFRCFRKPERKGRNPATGKIVTVKPNLALQFKTSPALKLELKQTNPYAKKKKESN